MLPVIMNQTPAIMFVFTAFNCSFGQTDTIKLEQFGDSSEFSKLSLNPDKSFEFHHYNIQSCWTWYSVYGIWKTDNNEITFTDTLHWEEDLIDIDTSIDNKTDYVLLTVHNDIGEPLKGIKIRYSLNWSSSSDNHLTDENGQIKIWKDTIAKEKSKKYNTNDVQFAIYFSNKKHPECSVSTSFDPVYDKIEITIVDSPKEDLVIRTTIYKIDCDKIYFESQTYASDKGYEVQNWGNFRTITGRMTSSTIFNNHHER